MNQLIEHKAEVSQSHGTAVRDIVDKVINVLGERDSFNVKAISARAYTHLGLVEQIELESNEGTEIKIEITTKGKR